ncbi:pupal cuticle protein Edg-78E-like [Eupeodes corollae]|uniref:pupal cuticle protein Edg-78E-like n=1 Tax=Eupeodes corollae TaxID=290404 RepID=UPI0024936EDD|nr:pupal cuticle protein Edg-78E-like [Eupeodes corollae]XP_055913325.1 pupal cuticle protein Edg-78E-like [Eupeodes corollae]
MFRYVALIALIGFCAAAPLDSEVGAETKALENEISPEGVFHYAFQTSNGIDVNSAGDANAIQGAYKYVSPEGQAVVLNYVADAEGYHPSGELLPTPPPVPELIVRALSYLAAHPQKEEPIRKLL